jgi:hypothetical protein
VYWEEIMDRRDAASWWAPDSSGVLYLQSDESSVSFFPLPDFEPAVPRVREQRYPKAGGINPTVRAGFVDLEGGRPAGSISRKQRSPAASNTSSDACGCPTLRPLPSPH